jgi:hypothetical protein
MYFIAFSFVGEWSPMRRTGTDEIDSSAKKLSQGRTHSSTDARLPPCPRREDEMAEKPTLFVCHGDDGGPRIHPCRRVQEALRAADIEYEKVVAAHGSPFPFLRKGSREELRAATGATKLPALKLSDGTVLTHSRAILAWIDQQRQIAPRAATGQGANPSAP